MEGSMKGIFSRTAVLVFCVLVAGGSRAHAIEMTEGEWEIVSETSITMGGMSMPGMTSKETYCLTREDPVPATEKDCKVVDHKVVGNKVTWHIVCKEGEGEGEITYAGSGRSYAGAFRMKTTEGAEVSKKRTEKSAAKAKQKTAAEGAEGEAATMTMKLSGKYLGPCPAGQRSGPTRETARRADQAKVMSEQAKAQSEQAKVQMEQARIQAAKMEAEGKKAQEEQAARARKAEEFIKNTVVPPDDPGAHVQDGFAITKQCREKLGNNVPEAGIYAMRFEKASAIGQFRKLDVERDELLLDDRRPVPEKLKGGRAAKVKCGKGKITWSSSEGGLSVNGGIVFSGKTVEGAVRSTMSHGSEGKSEEVVKVTGKWLGGRDYTSQPRGSASGEASGSGTGAAAGSGTGDGTGSGKSGEKGKSAGKGGGSASDNAAQDAGTGSESLTDKVKNPVKGIRNLFGF
jgi:hypothetical protein